MGIEGRLDKLEAMYGKQLPVPPIFVVIAPDCRYPEEGTPDSQQVEELVHGSGGKYVTNTGRRMQVRKEGLFAYLETDDAEH